MSRIGTINTAPARVATAATFRAVNPTLLTNQTSLESDTGAQKLGDGTTRYNDLPYLVSASLKYGVMVASDTPIDGTAANPVLVTSNGGAEVTIAQLRAILDSATHVAELIVFNGGDGTGQGAYVLGPNDTDAWIPVPLKVGQTVLAIDAEQWGYATNAAQGGLPDPETPATKIDFIDQTPDRLILPDGSTLTQAVTALGTAASGASDLAGVQAAIAAFAASFA